MHTRTVVFGGTDSNAPGDDDMRKVIGKVNDIRKKKVRAEQHLASDVMNMLDNLHDAEETEGVYVDDVRGEELSKENVTEAR